MADTPATPEPKAQSATDPTPATTAPDTTPAKEPSAGAEAKSEAEAEAKQASEAKEPTPPEPAPKPVPEPAAEPPLPPTPDADLTATPLPIPPASAQPPLPAKDTVPTGPQWPQLADTHPLAKFATHLPDILAEAGHTEIYTIDLAKASDFHRKLILQKFLRANANNLDLARLQLLNALKWRAQFNPTATKSEVFSSQRFGGLGFVTTLKQVPGSVNESDIATFNIYGAVKDNKATFGDIEGFLRWRVALMELGIEKLGLPNATTPIPDYGEGVDQYQGIQVHDYLQVSFLRQDPHQKAAAKAAIDVFSKHYPETLSRKLFVNVPVVMGWMFSGMKLVLPKETVRKFTVLSYGSELHRELGSSVPKVYGGEGEELDKVAVQPKLA